MLDLGPLNDGPEFERRIREYEKKVYNTYVGYSGKVPKVSHTFRFAALVAAYHIRNHLKCNSWDNGCLEDAVWGYNGRASWCKQSESAYLWSDPKNGVNLTMRYKKSSGEIVKYTDTRPGVMVIYKELQEHFKETK